MVAEMLLSKTNMRRLSPLEWLTFGLFGVWMLVGFFTTPMQISIGQVDHWGIYSVAGTESWLRSFIRFNLENGDALIIGFAAINTHLIIWRLWGGRRARIWALRVIGLTAAIETLGVLTGFPFGSYTYTSYLGPRLGGLLPLAIPFAWYVIVTNCLVLLRQTPLSLLPLPEAVVVGLMATTYDWIMEPFAWKIRAYWQWTGNSVPFQNYVTWLVLATCLVRGLAPQTQALRLGWDFRPALMIGSFVLLFIITRCVHGV
jgi:hypothetical protein